MSFSPVRNLISYRVYVRVIIHVSLRYYNPLWSVVDYRHACETSYLLYMILVQNVVRFHTGTNVSYRYKNRSELVRVRSSVPVSCKRIQSYKWAPGSTRTGMKLVPVSCKHPLSSVSTSYVLASVSSGRGQKKIACT